MNEDILKTHNTNEEKSKNKFIFNRTKLIAAISALAVVIGLSVYLSVAGTYKDAYPNTFVNGVEIGGFTYDEVRKIVEKKSADIKIPDKLSFTVKGKKLTVSSSEISLKIDAKKTADTIFGGRKDKGFWNNAANYTKSLFSDTNFLVSVKYDEKELNGILAKFVEPYITEPLDSSYEIKGDSLVITKGHQGTKLDEKALKQGISSYIINPKKPIELSIIDAKAKAFDLDEFYNEITSAATDAYYSRDSHGNVVVIADKPKVKVDKNDLKKAFDSSDEVVSIKITSTPAQVTKSQLEAAMFSGVMGEWTSTFNPGNTARTTNVSLAASRINGVVLLPGETFSYDKTVGPRTAANGFKSAGVYINNKVEQGIGGGICQTSSTLYSAVLYSNLEIITRTSHSLPVSYMPPGQDATIASGSIDFKFKNNTKYPVKIVAVISGGSVTCKIVGTPVKGQKVVINNTTTAVYQPKIEIATDASIPQGYKKTSYGSKGSAVSSTRTVYQNGVQVSTEKLTKSVYNSTPTTITVNPADKNTDPASLTEYTGNVTPDEPKEEKPITSEPKEDTSKPTEPPLPSPNEPQEPTPTPQTPEEIIEV